MKKQQTKAERLFFITLIMFLIFCAILEMKGWSYFHIPKELRESVTLKLADDFSKGINPYSIKMLGEEKPALFNCYGFINSIIAAAVMRIFHISASLSCTIITVLYKIGSLALTWVIARKITKNILLSLWAVILMYGCFWRYVPCGGAFPDQLGIFLTIFVYWIMLKGEKEKNFHPVGLAIIIIILFYTKLYFAVFAIGIAVFFLLKDRKSFYIFILSGGGCGIVSILLVNRIFPLYFTESIFYMGSFTGIDIFYSIKQILALWKYYMLPIAVVLVWFFITAKKIWQGVRQKPFSEWQDKYLFSYYLIIQIICMGLCLLYLGTNDGTWLTYHLQLLLPGVIFLCVFIIGQWKSSGKHAGFLIAIMLLSVLQVAPLNVDTSLTGKQIDTWNKVYARLDSYGEGSELLLSPPLSYYCVDNNIYTSHYGHSNGILEVCVQKWKDSPIAQILFPNAERIYNQNENYKKIIQKKVLSGEYDYIGIGAGDFDLTTGDFNFAYQLENKVDMYAGNHRWEMFFYTKKKYN